MANTPSTSEKGHAKNVANFNTLSTLSTGFANYNPANPALQPRALTETYNIALVAIDKVRDANAAYKLRVADRTVAFKPVGQTVTRLSKALKASPGISKEVKEAFAGLVRKYRGARKEAKAASAAAMPGSTQPEQISVAQISYDSRVAHFLDIKTFLAALPTYASNEPDLAITGVAATAAALDTANQNVVDAISALGNGRIYRDKILYTPETGLVDIGYQLKDYISSKYSAGSPQWKQISKLSFVRR